MCVVIAVSPVSYVRVNDVYFRVYVTTGKYHSFLGDAYIGAQTAYFRAPSGRGRLFGSLRELEAKLEQVAGKIIERVEA